MTLQKRLKNTLDKWTLLGMVGFFVVFGFSYIYHKSPLKIEGSLDKSLPYSLWFSLPYLKKPYVEFPVYWEDKYFKRKNAEYLVKILACDEFHYLRVDKDKNYYCDGEFLGKAVDTDSHGNPVRNFVYNGPIPKGKAFVIGTHKRSYDSRYFGFIDKSKIIRYLYPIY